MASYTKYLNKKNQTPQTQPIPGSNQVRNNAGGFSFKADDWTQLQRFLILGSVGGTYYVSEKKLTEQNMSNIIACIKSNGVKVVNEVVSVSDSGRAVKNESAIFILALCLTHGDNVCRKAAEQAVNKVCRIGTHIFALAEYLNSMRGWGRTVRRVFQNWYESQSAKDLSYQMVKYQQRNGWSHRDLLRLSHPKGVDSDHKFLYQYVVGKMDADDLASLVPTNLSMIFAFEQAKANPSKKNVLKLIDEYNLPRECIPTELLTDADVWQALLDKSLPLTALTRNLANMTRSGLFDSKEAVKTVVSRLNDQEYIKKSRLHPMSILVALRTYQNGSGFRGTNTWNPNAKIVDALDSAFYLAFGNVEPTNKTLKLSLDVSGSMGSPVAGSDVLTCRDASAAMALVTARVESDYEIMGFTNKLVPLNISPRQRLDDVIKTISGLQFGSTDCGLPIYEAIQKKQLIDSFIVFTDSETYAGRNGHPAELIKTYRNQSGIKDASMIVVGMNATSVSIADPNDSRSLDVVGFDTNTPNVMSSFIRGDF